MMRSALWALGSGLFHNYFQKFHYIQLISIHHVRLSMVHRDGRWIHVTTISLYNLKRATEYKSPELTCFFDFPTSQCIESPIPKDHFLKRLRLFGCQILFICAIKCFTSCTTQFLLSTNVRLQIQSFKKVTNIF